MRHITRTNAPPWIVPATLVGLFLGFLLVFAANNPERAAAGNDPFGTFDWRSSAPNYGRTIDEKDAEIGKLREEITRLQNALADESRQSKVLNDSLQEAKLLAGITKVEGPGIEIMLKDSDQRAEDPFHREQLVIHDQDVMRTVNELWASGAEAIAVNKQRLAINTFVRCEGPVIYIGKTPISSPVVIRAIGDPDTLYGALTMQGRFLDEIRSIDPKMVEVTKVDRIVLPAFSGSTQFNYAKATTADK